MTMSENPAVLLKDVRKDFRNPDGGRLTVLNIPDFRLAKGEQLAVEGPSGSGKTTFLHIIAGIRSPDSGTVEVMGTGLSSLTEAQRDVHRAKHTGYVCQGFNLLQGYTVLENILISMSLAGRPDPAHAMALLERVGLSHRMRHRPSELSAGQQQRVAIARAFSNRPEVLLADEPTGNLDPASATQVLGLIQEFCASEKAALILVSHDRDVLSRFDRRLPFGRINMVPVFPGVDT